MFRNYFVITIRNLVKHRTYSLINISGLSVGITCSLLILLWVADELSFDRSIPKYDRLFQVWVNSVYEGKTNSWRAVPLPTHEAMKAAHNKIKRAVVYDWGSTHLLTAGETRINKRGHYASEEFLEMFEFPMLRGNAAQVLDDPTSIVISQSTAKALFGEEDPVNQLIRVDNTTDLKVTGVFTDVPENSSLQFDYLVPWKVFEQHEPWVQRNKTNWGNYSFQVSLELDRAESEADVENAVRDMLTKNGQTDMKREFFLHPLSQWRLHSSFKDGYEEGGMIEYVQMFTTIAIFILVIACINFMNLATARSERRAREVGIRKSIGSRRFELIMQFMGESIFIATLATAIGVLMAELSLPFYNNLVHKHLYIDYTSLQFWVFVLGLIAVTGIVSGSYPALYLSAFQPAKVLKGKVQASRSGTTPRKVLVTLQFGFSILLIIGTFVIYQQIVHVKSRGLGYDEENLITIPFTNEIKQNYKTLKQELLRAGLAVSVTRSNSPITDIYSNNFLGWPGKPAEQKVIFATVATEYDYLKTMGIKLLLGRDFSEEFRSDTAAIIINKAALDLMNLKDPIGTKLDWYGEEKELIGVVDNVLMGNPYEPVAPMLMLMVPDWVSAMTIRLEKTNDLPATMKKVESIFKTYNPAYPFEYKFADAEFARKFETINMTSDLASVFSILAIVITGLGLFGLASFTAEQRTKELGIRKVLGASVSSLVGLMNRDFSRLVIMAFLISAPIAWWIVNELVLSRYTYRVNIAWWIFPLTGLLALIFALAIVSTQAMRAARTNPVNSLRSE